MKKLSLFQIAVFCLLVMCNQTFADIVTFVDAASGGEALKVLPAVSGTPSGDFGVNRTLTENASVTRTGAGWAEALCSPTVTVEDRGILPQQESTLGEAVVAFKVDFESCDGQADPSVDGLSGSSHDSSLNDTETTWFRISKLSGKTK